MEPYKGGKGEQFFSFWRLNVIDKHRAIVPAVAGLAGIEFAFTDYVTPPSTPSNDIGGARFPLKHSDEVTRRVFHMPEFYADTHFVLHLVFGKSEVFEGEPIFSSLKQSVDLVAGTIDSFARNIFSLDSW
jgi:hypothetical protein